MPHIWHRTGYSKANDAILAVDVGGTNIRAGVVVLNLRKGPDLSKATVWKFELWRHGRRSPRNPRRRAGHWSRCRCGQTKCHRTEPWTPYAQRAFFPVSMSGWHPTVINRNAE